MILVDTSVWIDFFRTQQEAASLEGLLETNEVILHPWVLGELALGNLGSRRAQIQSDLRLLPTLEISAFEELVHFIERERLHGSGLGWVDVELLYAALTHEKRLWTGDRALLKAARSYGCSYL